ncbi:glycosyltransferase family 4 protein [Hydrogenophaga sp.]|uniref:glycosyltransferase family 4 protein n=1 Tax=Hydrogenophaga sp. TaxID=1904254 RepID=UPI0025C51BDB|nr:glycosyltransferase family 4 protein [Hydrogenophaga sp.]MBT9463741.1 glycosyltransferase family 4 protein [Hydrogenophaga sp.]
MNILHVCLSNYYIDRFSYQENEIVHQNVIDGHNVKIVASTETFGENRELVYVRPSKYIGSDGAEVVRLPYLRLLPHFIMRKLRIHPGFKEQLEAFQPEVILFHGTCGWELNTVANYKRQNPSIKLYVDSHEDFNNSARTWISKWVLHFLYYRTILRHNLKWIDRILCVNVSAMEFLENFYGIPSNQLEFFPLGGKVLKDAEYLARRKATRSLHQLEADHILFVQSGKMDSSKKFLESLRAFSRIKNPHFRFIAVGHIHDDIASEAEQLIKGDPRITFDGWKSPEELRDLLCAADVYVQPGTQSVTMQMSLCCRCAVMIADVSSHQPYINANGWLIGTNCKLDQAFQEAAEQPHELQSMAENSHAIASRLLDYRSLAARLYR